MNTTATTATTSLATPVVIAHSTTFGTPIEDSSQPDGTNARRFERFVSVSDLEAIQRAKLAAMKSDHRCPWPGDLQLMIEYHDTEWGTPLHDDRKHFEFLVLDAAQAGLSWRTVLLKRENYRKAFDGFDANKVARYSDKRVAKLLENPGIIRNRLKVESAVTNAQRFLDVQDEFGSFDLFVWRFVDGRPRVNRFKNLSDIPARTAESDAMSKELKARGFTFVGTTICYAYMQAAGLVNDHLVTCFRHAELRQSKG